MNLDNRHSDIEHREGEESPHSFPLLPIPPLRRLLGIFCAVCAATWCLLSPVSPTLTTPVHAFSKQTREAGALVFHDKGCEHCHGINGLGTDRGPDLSGIGKRWKKDHIEQQILNGGGGMPPFADALQPDEVKSLVDFLSAKRKPSKIKPPAAPQPVPRPSPSDDTGI